MIHIIFRYALIGISIWCLCIIIYSLFSGNIYFRGRWYQFKFSKKEYFSVLFIYGFILFIVNLMRNISVLHTL